MKINAFPPMLCLLLLSALVLPAVAQEAPERMPKPLAFADAAAAGGPVYVIPIEGMIDGALASYLDRALADAAAADAALVLLHLDTFGGLVDAADQMRQALLDAEVPTVAFIDHNAASAGALISYAADRIVMVPGASIGAATVVEGSSGEAAPDKYQSYMRGMMRTTAEANGRDPAIAEAMVDERLDVPGVVAAGQVLTLSASEALALGVADAILPTVEETVAAFGMADHELVAHRATWAERVLRFFASPVLQSILMLMMLGGLYFEMQTPGVGFAGLAAFVGAALFFAPHYLLGLVESWEIALFVLGVLLILLELFLFPGFGVAGIAGILCVTGSLLVALVPNYGFSFPSFDAFAPAIATMATTFLLFILLVFSLGRMLPRSERFNRLVLAPELSSAAGYTSSDSAEELVGQLGTALTPLRPAGVVEIGGERVDVVTAGEFVERGTAVQVVKVRGSRVEVRPARALPADPETSPA